MALGDGDTDTDGCGAHSKSSGAVIRDGGVSLDSLFVPAVAEVAELDMLRNLLIRGGTLPGGSLLGALKAEPVELELNTVWT